MTDSESTNSAGRYKVERVVERYDLGEMPEQLERRWKGDETESVSLRDLAHEFNLEVLRRTLERADQSITTPELGTAYRILQGIEGRPADRTKVRRDLERRGINVDRLEKNFVTHQAIHTYLTKGRGVTKSVPEAEPIERASETIDRLRSRTAAVAQSELDRLRSSSEIEIGDVDVLVRVTVNCRDCGAYLTVAELLDQGGCECDGTVSE